MNYADEATRFLDEANEAERAAKWRSERLYQLASEQAASKSPGAGFMEMLVDQLHDRLKDEDKVYKSHVSRNAWLLQKAIANAALAQLWGHRPTGFVYKGKAA